MTQGWLRHPIASAVVVFVHGFLSSSETAWTNENGTTWPSLLEKDENFKEFGIFLFEYKTGLLSKSYGIEDITNFLYETMKIENIIDLNNIIFVCHSMGGIVVRKLLVQKSDIFLGKIINIYLVASPSLGSDYPKYLKAIVNLFGNEQAKALKFSQSESWLNTLDKEFIDLKESKKLTIIGKEIYEDKPIKYRKFLFWNSVVEPISGKRYFADPLKIPDSDHSSIAKPASETDFQHRLLIKFLEDIHVLQVSPDPCDAPSEAHASGHATRWHSEGHVLHDGLFEFAPILQQHNEGGGCFLRPMLVAGRAPPTQAAPGRFMTAQLRAVAFRPRVTDGGPQIVPGSQPKPEQAVPHTFTALTGNGVEIEASPGACLRGDLLGGMPLATLTPGDAAAGSLDIEVWVRSGFILIHEDRPGAAEETADPIRQAVLEAIFRETYDPQRSGEIRLGGVKILQTRDESC